MSVLVEFAIFPTDKGESVSGYVSRILKMFKEGDVPYQLTPMGTIFETDTMVQALKIIENAYDLKPASASKKCFESSSGIEQGVGYGFYEPILSWELEVVSICSYQG